MRALTVITLLAALILPTVAFAEIQTFTATHTYILGDHDSKDDARQRCLLEAKRKILEQAGVYIESASEVKNFDLTKDKITSFAAAVMQVKDTKENFGFENGHMTLTLKLTAQVDLEEVRKQLAARQLDAGVREDVAMQKERLKRLEAQLEAMQNQQQVGQTPGRGSASPPSDISAEDCLASIRFEDWRQLELRGPSSGLGSPPGSVGAVLVRVHSQDPLQVRPPLPRVRPGFSPWRPVPDSWGSGVPESPHDGPLDPLPRPSSSGL